MQYRQPVVFRGDEVALTGHRRVCGELLRERCGGAASGAGVWCEARERGRYYTGTSGVSRKNVR